MMHHDKFYAVKNDKGEFAHIEMDKLTWETGFATVWLSLNKPYAKRAANDYGGHVVELAEKHAPVVVSEAEAKILTEAKTATYPAEYITRHSYLKQGSEDRLMRAYVIGWTVEKPKLWNVKVPHTKDVWYYKSWNSDLRTISDKELCSEFTEAEIEHYYLQDCEREEVTDDEKY